MAGPFNTVLEKLHLTSPSAPQPKEPSAEELQSLREKYNQAGQGQVFTFYDSLSSAEQAGLFEQLAGFDPKRINEIFDRAVNPPKAADDDKPATLEPLPESATSSIYDTAETSLKTWYESGLELISQNKVGVVLMAGGQGTRLGSSAPKGCYDIGLPSKKSLFQLQGERILKLQRLAQHKYGKESVVIPWYVMTSGPTRKPTETFFKENNYFGLQAENVVVFEQGVLPCISNEGKILLESKAKVRLPTIYIVCNSNLD